MVDVASLMWHEAAFDYVCGALQLAAGDPWREQAPYESGEYQKPGVDSVRTCPARSEKHS